MTADEPLAGTRWAPVSLASLPLMERQALLRLGRRRQYNAGETMLAEGDRTTFAVIILDGYVKITART